ncbi:MAG: NAD-dependent epimerase/dehydratase family protein [Cyclobacteriaceae bacterium]
MKKRVLISGGAGFIGSHLTDELIAHGYEVRILDNLLPQVHGENADWPDYLHPEAELLKGDVRSREDLKSALHEVDVVYHLAARVGVGQSMYQIQEYMDVNDCGTAVLLEMLAKNPVEKLVVASSMSIYGEGLYQNASGKIYHNQQRSLDQLKNGQWELSMGEVELQPIPTPESKKPALESVYALSKYDQERLALICGQAYDIPTVALRFFNVYGTRQALSNPYTGVLAIFASRFLNDKPPLIFEDGQQKRDFVHVKDVAQACRLAMEKDEARNEVFNIGSGHAYTVSEIAERIGATMQKEHIRPVINKKYRVGDIRHCFADISKARQLLGYEPKVGFDQGLQELTDWLSEQIAVDQVDKAEKELADRGLTV